MANEVFENINRMDAEGGIASAKADWDSIVADVEAGKDGAIDGTGNEAEVSGRADADIERTGATDEGAVAETEPAVSTTDAATEGKDPAAETPAAETWTPPTKEEYEQIKTAASTLEQLNKTFANAPETLTAAYFEAMTPAQQQVFLARLGVNNGQAAQTPAAVAPDLENFDPELASPAELLAYQNRDWLQNGAQQTANYVQQALNTEMEWVTPHLSAARLQGAVAEVALPYLFELLGVSMPAFDAKAAFAAISTGQSPEDAVRAQIDKPLKTSVALKKQQNKPTPTTPGNGSATTVRESDTNKTFQQIAKEVAADMGVSLK